MCVIVFRDHSTVLVFNLCAVFRLKDLTKKAHTYGLWKEAVVKHSEIIGREEEENRYV